MADGLGSPKVADHRDDEVSGLQVFHDGEIGFSRQITAVHPGFVGGRHQIVIGGRIANPIAVRVERLVHVLDAVEIVGRQRKMMRFCQAIFDCFQILTVDRARLRHLGQPGHQFGHRRIRANAVRLRAREQQRDELRAVAGHLEQGFVHELQLQVAAPDVEDDGHRRAQRDDIGEVLFRPHPKVDAGRPRPAHQLRNHILELQLVRGEVF